ncbi:hypothetical protein [Nocardioides sp.]|uniref:hypothetical protein n=1 Tax=Nocardioides sp. TaxID=35761 RepID=UPI0032194520
MKPGPVQEATLPVMLRGGSRGFTVLLLGGVVQPLVGVLSAPLGYVWLLLVALAAFVVAARTALPAGSAQEAWPNGPGAASISYALVLPLVLSVSETFPLLQIVLTSTTALVVGTAVGLLRVRRSPTLLAPTGEGNTP